MEKFPEIPEGILGDAITLKRKIELRLKAKKLDANENAADSVTEQQLPNFDFCLFSLLC